MLTDGLYGVHFKTSMGEGSGVVVIAGGQLRGGDSVLAYSGTCSQDGDNFSASVTTSRHATGSPSVFGVDIAHIILKGQSSGSGATCTGTAAEMPNLTFQAVMKRIGD